MGVSRYSKGTCKLFCKEIGGDVFSLLIDKASDVSDKEQMAVVLRYVDKLGLILERLVGIVHVKETSATCLKSALEKLLIDIGLSFKQVRGQCYDGAIGASCKRKDMIRETNRENVKRGISSGRISTGTGLNQDQSLQRAGDTRCGSHYRTLSSLIQLFPSIVKKFDDRFNEVNSSLLIHMASFNPKNSFAAFNPESLLKLAEFYPQDFHSSKLMDLGHELRIYIDKVRVDKRFANLDGIADLAKKLVDTKKHLAFPLVYQLLKLVLILPVATASVERCFSAMNIVKCVLRNKMGDKFMSDSLICYVEKDIFLPLRMMP
ncbi:uncharacterized protein LOC123398314 [Hordeum vulgare subsp. vulgare]|uniref:uncharacterized protein LOC123398314 n=1 Tax=Hordeum vulgare subsp. vulgare TaxID=112509 RepID=UPI001D1A33C5|nr:uncharacterized protein LOC123398314 [Hordeum vulgare subsp. vulgare]